MRSLLPQSVDPATGADAIAALARVDLAAALPALGDVASDGITARGNVPAGASIYVATTAAREWRLEVGGQAVERGDAFGWANAFRSAPAGEATLTYDTPLRRRLLLIGQVAVWIVALVALSDVTQRRRAGVPTKEAGRHSRVFRRGTARSKTLRRDGDRVAAGVLGRARR